MRKFAALSFVLFLLIVAYWANTGTMPRLLTSVYAFPDGDRFGHIALYGVLAFLLNAALPGRQLSIGRFPLPLGAVLAAVFAALEEFSQFFFSSRTPDWIDLSCGLLGILAATMLQRWAASRALLRQG